MGNKRNNEIKWLNCVQLNCNHTNDISTLLEKELMDGKVDILLLQEPAYDKKDKKIIFSKRVTGGVFYNCGLNGPRSAIIINKVLKNSALMINQLSDDHFTAVRIKAANINYLFVSVYVHHDKSAADLKKKLNEIEEYVKKENMYLVMGGDFNAKHNVWNSQSDDEKGRIIMDAICTNKWHLLNSGEPTFYRSNGYVSTLDLTIVGDRLYNSIKNWEVDEFDIYGSDHKPINFKLMLSNSLAKNASRNVRRTDWVKFKEEIEKNLEYLKSCRGIWNRIEPNHRVERLEAAIRRAFHEACPVSFGGNKCPSWENADTKAAYLKMKKTSNYLKRIKRKKIRMDPDEFLALKIRLKEERAFYTNLCIVAKREESKKFMDELNSISDAARLTNVMKKVNVETGTLKKADDLFTNNTFETIGALMEKHFPNAIEDGETYQFECFASRNDKRRISKLINEEKVIKLINEFKPYKSPPDELYPVILKNCVELMAKELVKIYKFCLNSGITPINWLRINVIFIPKVGKGSYNNPSHFRPISLMSFLFKTLEKFVNKAMLDRILNLHFRRFAYRKDNSCINALNEFMDILQPRMSENKVTMTSFLDIDGAFNNIIFSKLKEALIKNKVPRYVVDWVNNANSNRLLKTKILGEEKTVKAELGIAQGSNSAPFYFLIYINELVVELNKLDDIEAFCFSDDIAIACTENNIDLAAEKLENALKYTIEWCERNEMMVNPEKAKHVIFKPENVNANVRDIKFGQKDITWSKVVKYLGVMLDDELNFNEHFKYIKSNITQFSLRIRNFIKIKWGFSPTLAKWCYECVVIPRMSYASSIWIHKINEVINKNLINSAQSLALRSATDAMKGTPNRAIRMAMGAIPIVGQLKINATIELCRLMNVKRWKNDGKSKAKIWLERNLKLNDWSKRLDSTISVAKGKFKVTYPTRHSWENNFNNIWREVDYIFYTDASVNKELKRTGIGIYCPELDTQYAGESDVIMSSFKAESIAISKALSLANNSNISNCQLLVVSDSMSALKALENNDYRSKIINGVHEH